MSLAGLLLGRLDWSGILTALPELRCVRKGGIQRRRLLDSDVLGSPPLVRLSLVRELREVNVQVTVTATRLLKIAFLLLFKWTSLLVDW